MVVIKIVDFDTSTNTQVSMDRIPCNDKILHEYFIKIENILSKFS